jgi:signal transduction histidine kinase
VTGDARLARMTAQFRALHAIDVALSSSLDEDEVLRLILEKAVELVGAEHGSLRLLVPETGDLPLRAFLGSGWTPEVQAYTPRIGQGIAGRVAAARQPYLCPDVRDEPQNVVLFPDMRSMAAVPLLAACPGGDARGKHDLLGVLLLESARPAAFDEQALELLTALAQTAVMAIQNAIRYHELARVHSALQLEQERRLAAEKWTVMGQTATALAHRINNLVGVIPASAAEVRRTLQKVEMPAADRAWIDANLGRVERNARFVLGLSEALFRPFKEAGRPILVDVNRMLAEALAAADLPPDIEVRCDYGHDVPAVEGSSLLVDVFLELINNARKALQRAARPNPFLRVQTWSEPGEPEPWVAVAISDSGQGLADEQAAHLWDLFQPSSDGLGFGLWWVRTFVERQGGRIGCDNRPGEGATFTVRLPARAASSEQQAASGQPEAERSRPQAAGSR